MSESNFLSARTGNEPDSHASLLHVGRSSLSIVIGLLEDLIAGENIVREDIQDALNAGHHLHKTFDQLEPLIRDAQSKIS